MVWYCIECGNAWEHDDTACPECGSLNFDKRGKPQITKQHCTQCESKKENPWCSNCKEKDCIVSSDGTCEMLRKYLSITAEVERLKGELAELKDKKKYFIMPIEPHEPIDQIRICNECVLSHGSMCLDRSYCKHHEEGKTWKKRL